MNEERRVKLINRLAGVLSLLAAGVAALALWSWGAGVSDLFTSRSQHVPMAPSAAFLLILVGWAVFLRTCWPDRLNVRWFGRGAAAVATVAGLFAGVRGSLGWEPPLET
jgi:hypothetical protein